MSEDENTTSKDMMLADKLVNVSCFSSILFIFKDKLLKKLSFLIISFAYLDKNHNFSKID